ncbi:MAG: hypothetical protein GXP45_05915 [bacterium]|nr:hypothetical protein [bacterium]
MFIEKIHGSLKEAETYVQKLNFLSTRFENKNKSYSYIFKGIADILVQKFPPVEEENIPDEEVKYENADTTTGDL